MEVFIFGCLAVCLLFFLTSISVNLITMEKKIESVTQITKHAVKKLYTGE